MTCHSRMLKQTAQEKGEEDGERGGERGKRATPLGARTVTIDGGRRIAAVVSKARKVATEVTVMRKEATSEAPG